MVTITAPSSNPTPIYNRTGITVDVISPGASSSPTQITRMAGYTVVMVLSSSGTAGPYVSLPSDAEIGDVVEIYPIEGSQTPVTIVVAPSSMLINSFFTTGGVGLYRKLTDSDWGAIWSKVQ